MNKYFPVVIIILLLFSISLNAQDSTALKNYIGNGLTINAGFNLIAVKDEFISQQKYTGSSGSFLLDWTRMHNDSGFHLSFGILNSARVNNYNASANITEAALNLSYVYPIGNLNIFHHDIKLFLGPAPELFIHYRMQNIAVGAIFDAYSLALLFSAGARLDMILPVNKDLQFEGNFYSSLLSLGGKFIDPRDNNTSMIKILTMFSGISSNFEASARYNLANNVSLKAGYRLNIIRISAWDFFISAKDDFMFSLTYGI